MSTTAESSSSYSGDPFELRLINSVRVLSADQPEAAKSGHPGGAMGCAPMAHLLFGEVMSHSPSRAEKYWNRDRFVLSNGHCSALQYAMLHLTGYDLTLDDLRDFRQIGSKTPGHPENFATSGVEVSTGPLGQGLSNAVGMAIGAAHMAATYNTEEHVLFDNHTYVICGDGCLQEGVTSEASSLAGHLGLGKLIVLYDDNSITIDGSTDLSFTEDVCARYDAYGWHTQTVDDVETAGLGSLRAAVAEARAETGRPSLIRVKTCIGFGSVKEGTEAVHGAPLGAEDLANVKRKFGLDPDKSFHVEDDVRSFYARHVETLETKVREWDATFAAYKAARPVQAAEIERRFAHELPDDAFDQLLRDIENPKELASRKSSALCLNALAPTLPELVGGSADLTPSNNTALKCSGDFQKDTPAGRYLRFGVREHAMAAICNGLFAHGGFRPYCATFLNFAGYALGAIRVSALSRFGVVYVMTHDSIGLGEDGPTHQPVEMLESLRAMPNLYVMRPCNTAETAGAYREAMTHPRTPTVLCLSRTNLTQHAGTSPDAVARGAYALVECAGGAPDLVLAASGSEVTLCVEAARRLEDQNNVRVRVVSVPCQELFLEQSEDYRRSVFPGDVPTLSVEASAPHGWHRFSHARVSVRSFGLSGKGSAVFDHFGFTVDNVVTRSQRLLAFYENKTVPDLNCLPDEFSDEGASPTANGCH